MSPQAGWLLVNEIVPRLRCSIPNSVRPLGCEDTDELVQDGTAIAARMLQSAEDQGKRVSAGNVAYYAVKHLKSGRRSTGSHKLDVLHPVAQLSGRSQVRSLDEPLAGDGGDEEAFTLGDLLTGRTEDPAAEAARRLDWQLLVAQLDHVSAAVLQALADGRDLTLLVRVLGRSRSTLQTHKHRLAGEIRECLGDDILTQVQESPGWHDGIEADRERSACRWERRSV